MRAAFWSQCGYLPFPSLRFAYNRSPQSISRLLLRMRRMYSRTSLFRTRLIRSPRYFEGRSNALGFTLPLYSSPVISKPRYFELFFISLGTSNLRGSTVCSQHSFGLPLRMYGMHITQFDHARLNLLSLVI